MRTYYQDGQVLITSTAMRVGEQRYDLDELDGVWRRSGALAGRRVMLAGGVLVAALTVRAGTSPTLWLADLSHNYHRWFSHGALTTALVAVAALIIMVGTVCALEVAMRAIEDLRGNGRHRELWVSVGGEQVLVLSTNDAVRFGKVCRALNRAMGNR